MTCARKALAPARGVGGLGGEEGTRMARAFCAASRWLSISRHSRSSSWSSCRQMRRYSSEVEGFSLRQVADGEVSQTRL